MKKKNLYFRNVMRRQNNVKAFVHDFFTSIASHPRKMLEVFIRKNFGERYFSLSTAITVMIFLLIWPLFGSKMDALFFRFSEGGYYGRPPAAWPKYITWYLFTIAFGYFVYLRNLEVKRNPSVFDFGKFSLYSGDINPFFFKLSFSGIRPDTRTVAIFYEPGLFIAAGIILALLGQSLGGLLIFTGIAYGFSYAADYKKGADFVMDKIDEMIMNEEMEAAFIDDEDAANTRGVRFYVRKPKGKSLREKVADSFIEESPSSEEKTYAV